MTDFIPIEAGQWVLAFSEPYSPHEGTMAEHLERFERRGGGWDSHRPEEIFMVHQVSSISPKTYMAPMPPRWRYSGSENSAGAETRHPRGNVIAVGKTEAEMMKLRAKFYEMGDAADYAIEAETDRRMAKFRERRYRKAEQKIHKLFPHFFGRGV